MRHEAAQEALDFKVAAQGYARDADGAPLDVVSNDCQRCGAECCLACIDKILFFGVICDTRGCDALGCNFCMHIRKIPGGESPKA